MSYTPVMVTPDTPEWLQERRNSIGASDLPAVLGISPYQTPLDVWRAKSGIDTQFDPVLAFIGHESEPIIEKWVTEFAPVAVTLEPGFMARSTEHPFLHATFDRVSHDPFLTWQFKTAHHYSRFHWNEGIPDDIRIQVQGEMLVAGTDLAAVAVWIGGREFKLLWEKRDDVVINELIIPQAHALWERVLNDDPPPPQSPADLNRMRVTAGKTREASETVIEAVEQRAVIESDIKALRSQSDAFRVAIGEYMGDADTLVRDGLPIVTYKYQNGQRSVDMDRLEREFPEAMVCVRHGEPYRVMRTPQRKERT